MPRLAFRPGPIRLKGMTGFFQTLLRPDREDEPERAEIARAANLLQIGEFQLLQLAYFEWHGREMAKGESDTIFRLYMIEGQVTPWARHYARRIIAEDARGELEDRNPAFHRYDSEYFRAVPLGVRRLGIAIACLSFVVVGGILVGHFAPRSVTSVLPPYFNENELRPAGSPARDLDGTDQRPAAGALRGS